MPRNWIRALEGYRYPVDLAKYKHRADHPGWFDRPELGRGNLQVTQRFEASFRTNAPEHLEVWLEVTFWKLFFDARVRDGQTRSMAKFFEETSPKPSDVWATVGQYLEAPTLVGLKQVAGAVGLNASIAVASTFPAFSDPDQFPMVDTRIAKWSVACLSAQNAADPSGPQLIMPAYTRNKAQVLTDDDWPFIESWINWCRHTASKLTKLTDRHWNARSVEMAVFHAWGGKDSKTHPAIDLEPLPPIEQPPSAA